MQEQITKRETKYTKCWLCGKYVLTYKTNGCNCGCGSIVCDKCNEDIPYPSEEDEEDNNENI
jgi:hypothetical protein